MMQSFESYRPYLFSIAYRMLGSAMDAEDMVQETFLRYQSTPPEAIRSPKAFLTTILTRLCMDQLHLARRKRETYLGPWLPEPMLTNDAAAQTNPEERVDRYETISLAFLMLLEQLQPFERAVFLLREVFDYEYAEIAAFLDKSEAACRQSFSRAKKHLADHQPRFPASPDTHRQMLAAFLRAVQVGDLTALTDLLAEDVTLWADGGGKVKGAATRPLFGRLAVARFSVGATRRFLPEEYRVELAEVNGEPALVVRGADRAYVVLTIDVEAQRIRTIRIIANPEKLAHV
ncbi:MAG TPA: RNA polymerase sigma-70 factor [Ktedonobacterales bacterium]